MFLPDVNVWLALIFEAHIHHECIKSWFNSIEDATYFFCRMSQQGFLRLSTNPSVFGEEALSLNKAWEIYDTILSDARISFINEPHGLERIWREYTIKDTYSPKVWNDAYLAAFAQSGGLRLVTMDKGFHQFKKTDCLILSA